MSRIEEILLSLTETADRIQTVIPEEEHLYHHRAFIFTMIASVNINITQGHTQPLQVIEYLENLNHQVNEQIDLYEHVHHIDILSVFDIIAGYFNEFLAINIAEHPGQNLIDLVIFDNFHYPEGPSNIG